MLCASIFVHDGKNIKLEEIALKTLHYDYSNDQFWLNSLVAGLDELCKKLKLKGNARFIFPGSLLLSKTLVYPMLRKKSKKK